MIKFEVVIAGTVVNTYSTREEAERRLDEIRHSFYAMVHPIDTMYIRKKNSWKAILFYYSNTLIL